MQILQMDEFLRSLKQNIDAPHSFLLGAGASIESGIQSASDCIWDWKKEIFLSQNPGAIDTCNNSKSDNVRRIIQNWLNAQNIYPAESSENEYSFFAEKAYPIADDRRKYFQNLVKNHEPSLGYHLISMLAQENIVKSVWTTNFDSLMLKCAYQYTPLVPVEITAETSDRVYRGDVNQELIYVALHGDYKYGELKNTARELDSQNSELIKALTYELTKRDLIVLGYSGRDNSLMDALLQVYTIKGSGKLFWCGYGMQVSPSVENLIDTANKNGRVAFYVPTEGFDSTMLSIAQHCMIDNKNFLSKINEIKNKLSVKIDSTSVSFSLTSNEINKVVSSNAFPISFPKQCYQFKIKITDYEIIWDYCQKLYTRGIMAVPYKGMIYAWASLEMIESSCREILEGNIELCDLDKKTFFNIGVLKELLLKTICCLLAESNGLGYSKSKIWDTSKVFKRKIGNKFISAYQGVKLSLISDANYTYLTFTPSFMYSDNVRYTKEEKKLFSDAYSLHINNGQPNKNINAYILEWVRKIIGKDKFSSYFPINSQSNFVFAISSRSALVGITCNSGKSVSLPSTIPTKRIVFRGREYKDPTLKFYDNSTHKVVEDFHPMRGIKNNYPIDYAMNNRILKSSISIGVLCPSNHEDVFANFLSGLNKQSPAKHNTDFLISFPGFYEAFKTGLNLPNTNSNKWQRINANKNSDIYKAVKEFGNNIAHKIDQLSSMDVDVVLIYIPEEYEIFTVYSDSCIKFDLHDYIKAYAAEKQIATQFIREKTIESDLHCQIMWSLSLAIYVKSGRIPWTISGLQPDTAFAGIGYSLMNCSNGNNIVVGCSHVYSSDGQGMKYKLSKIQDVTFDKKKNPYLSENEAYKIGLNIKDLFYKSFSEIPKRVVVHKRTPFRKEEIKGLVESLSSAGVRNIDLIEISYEDNLKCFALNKLHTDIDGFPVRRGLCFPVNNNTMYLYTHGIASSVINPDRKYIQGGKSIPLPLKIVRHYGSSDMTQISTEILGLSKMNWNSFNLYSKLPCTVESSNDIARIGWLLSRYEGSLYEYRYFM